MATDVIRNLSNPVVFAHLLVAMVNFCQETGAIEAHWENFSDETVIPIWQPYAEAVS